MDGNNEDNRQDDAETAAQDRPVKATACSEQKQKNVNKIAHVKDVTKKHTTLGSSGGAAGGATAASRVVNHAPPPNLKNVKSRVNSLSNAGYKPGGGRVKIESRPVDVSRAQPRVQAKSDYRPAGGTKKIEHRKMEWKAESKVGSLANAGHRPGGGHVTIDSKKLNFSDRAAAKVGSKDNAGYRPTGGNVKTPCQKNRPGKSETPADRRKGCKKTATATGPQEDSPAASQLVAGVSGVGSAQQEEEEVPAAAAADEAGGRTPSPTPSDPALATEETAEIGGQETGDAETEIVNTDGSDTPAAAAADDDDAAAADADASAATADDDDTTAAADDDDDAGDGGDPQEETNDDPGNDQDQQQQESDAADLEAETNGESHLSQDEGEEEVGRQSPGDPEHTQPVATAAGDATTIPAV